MTARNLKTLAAGMILAAICAGCGDTPGPFADDSPPTPWAHSCTMGSGEPEDEGCGSVATSSCVGLGDAPMDCKPVPPTRRARLQ